MFDNIFVTKTRGIRMDRLGAVALECVQYFQEKKIDRIELCDRMHEICEDTIETLAKLADDVRILAELFL